mmetsp:Transcript_64989/g.121014  ORF Transcript_64989/g.121014 Transcript_64989/m.121014 type:complete len:96 (+) Transcript_64989:900-1187(+)
MDLHWLLQCHGLWPDQSRGLAPMAASSDAACELVPKHAPRWLTLSIIILVMLLTIAGVMLYLLVGSVSGVQRQLGWAVKLKRGWDEGSTSNVEMV